jgi:hypothetical protein
MQKERRGEEKTKRRRMKTEGGTDAEFKSF